jgi:GAF domain-containing protein/HAMP domain-containing protein
MTIEPRKPIDGPVNNHERSGISLRARITLATTITAVVAAMAVGYFAYTRNQATQKFLGDKFQNATSERAQSQIEALAADEARKINNFFISIDLSVGSTAAYTANLLSVEVPFADTTYWEANQKLTRISGGGWDNPNNDIAAIFAPSSFRLTEQTVSTANTLSHLDFVIPELVVNNSNIVAMYFGNHDGYTYYFPNVDLAKLVPPDFDPSKRSWFTKAENSLYKNSRVVWSKPYIDAAQHGLVVTSSIPVIDANGIFHGVIGADVKLETITSQVKNIQIGETGYAFLSDNSGNIISMPDLGYIKFEISTDKQGEGGELRLASLHNGPSYLQPVFNGMARHVTGLARVKLQGIEHYLAFTPILTTGYSLGLVVPAHEMDIEFRNAQALVTRENQATQNFGLLLIVAVVIAATIVSYVASQLLTIPLNQLTSTAKKVSAGDLTAQAPISSVSEVNVLANTFNSMTSQLKDTLAGLENRVIERTAELKTANEQIRHRASQFEAIAQVARSISNSQDLETLLPNITRLISEHFGFYHVGIFLLDANGEFAVLRAANSPGGKKMLERAHQLKVGETGIVGYVTGQGKPRIALDTGADAVYFNNPDLPDTHSEMALPLMIGNQVIGALDVQSLEPNAFSHEDIETLSTLADQVSIAIQNARLYEETRRALGEYQTLYRQFSQSGWSQFKNTQKPVGIRRSKSSNAIFSEPLPVDTLNGSNTLDLKINLHGHKIGSLRVQPADNREWTQDEIDIATAILDRAALALENARLLDDAKRRATREQVIGEVSSKISSAINLDSILQTALREMGRILPGAEISIQVENN